MLGVFLTGVLAAAPGPVAVHYFENRTTQRDYDVLCKGLADMLVTDLVQVPGVTVVERERLESVLGELKLQRGEYFDATKATQVGKLLGARLIITGAFIEVSPTLSIEARVLDVKDGRIVSAARVNGTGEAFFALEQELAGKLAQVLAPGSGAIVGTAPQSVDTALAYGSALDASDRGDVKEASRRLGDVLRAAPDFQLGKQRHAELVEALAKATAAHDAQVGEAKRELTHILEEEVANRARTSLDREFCARHLLSELVLRDLREANGEDLSSEGVNVLERRHQERALTAMGVVSEHLRSMLETLRTPSPMLFSSRLCDDTANLWVQELRPQLAALGVERPRPVRLSAAVVGSAYLRLVAFGELPPWSKYHAKVFPSLATKGTTHLPVATARKRVDEHLALHRGDLERAAKFNRTDPADALAEWVDLAGQVDVLFGRPDAAIEKWQTFLVEQPRAKRWAQIKERLSALLGTSDKAKAFSRALGGCDPELQGLLPYETQRVAWAEGVKGLERLMSKVETTCAKNPSALETLYTRVTLESAMWNECALLTRAERKLAVLQPQSPHTLTADFCE